MKVNEIDFSKYTYKRICIDSSFVANYPSITESVALKVYGDCEVDGEPMKTETAWLVINVKKFNI